MKKILLSTLLLSALFSNAQSWTEKSTGFAADRTLNNISIVDANTIWANAIGYVDPLNPDYTIKEFTRSIDGGETWVPGVITLGVGPTFDDMAVASISAVSATTAWVSAAPGITNTGGIWQTTDAGVTWNKQPTALFSNASESYANFVYFWDANNGVAQGDPEGGEFEIYTTSDGGTTWVRVPGADIPDPIITGEYGWFDRYCVAGNSIWFGTDNGRVFRSADMGLTWNVSNSPSVDFALDRITFSDANKGLLMTYDTPSTALYSTVDAGVTWNLVTTTGTFYNVSIRYVPNTSKVVSSSIATPLGSSFSEDDGVTWTNIDTVFRGELAFLNDTFGFSGGVSFDASTGGIYKFTGVLLGNSSFDVNKQFSASPNPTDGLLHVNSATSLIKEVSIYDLIGRQVYDEKFYQLNEVNLDLKSLQTGAYLLKVTSDSGKTETLKLLKN